MEFNFKEKVVLVTGASAGIGEATAILFAKYGAQLAITGRDEERLKSVAKVCDDESGLKTLAIVADLATDEGCKKTAKDTIDRFGRLDVLVNNAGVGARQCIQTGGVEDLDRVFATNMRGVYLLTHLLVPNLLASKGNIVNVSSINGSMPNIGCLPYSMTKASLDHFTKNIALELAPIGVRANVVSPGLTVSKFTQRLTDYTDDEYKAWLAKGAKDIPMGRVCDGVHIAKAILYLASEHADLVTGVILNVDGGFSLAGAGNSTAIKEQIKNKIRNEGSA